MFTLVIFFFGPQPSERNGILCNYKGFSSTVSLFSVELGQPAEILIILFSTLQSAALSADVCMLTTDKAQRMINAKCRTISLRNQINS